jgi:hypothetical protein
MKDAMKDKDPHLVIERASKPKSIIASNARGNRDISEIARIRGILTIPSFARIRLAAACAARKGQYIGRAIFATVCLIPTRHHTIGDETNG